MADVNFRFHTNVDDVVGFWVGKRQTLVRNLRQMMTSILQSFGWDLGYPPPAPVPSYQRTYTLARSLQYGGAGNYKRVEVNGYRIIGGFGSKVGYASYVIGTEDTGGRQAWMHAGRWWTLKGKFEDFLSKAMDIAENYLREWTGGFH